MKKQILLFAMVISLCCSCKKNSSNDTRSVNNLSILENKVVGKWQLVSSIDSNTAFDPAIVTDITRDCEKDDVYDFYSDKTYTIDDATYKCLEPMIGANWKIGTDSSLHVEIVHTLSSAYPKLQFVDEQKMIIQSRYYSGPTSGSVYTTNVYRRI